MISPSIRVTAAVVTVALLAAITAAIPISLSNNGNGTPGAGLLSTAAPYTPSPANCGQVEFDVFNFNANGVASQDLFQYLSPGATAALGVNFAAPSPYTITLPQALNFSGIQLEIILSSLQGSYAGVNGQTFSGFVFSIDNITVSLNTTNGQTFTFNQAYNALGNNFTFTNASVNNISAATIANFTISIVQVVANTSLPTASTCSVTYVLLISNPVGVRGDPQFVGLRGQSYQIHGIDGAVYNIISAKDYQLNSRFVFLADPRPCPLIPSTGRKSSACWTHPGSFLGQIGLKTSKGDLLFIAAGPAAVGFELVKVNGKRVSVGDANDMFSYNSTHELTATFGPYTVVFENSDMFINLRSVYLTPGAMSQLASHGLLGQTWNNHRYSGQVKEIEGEVDDYMIAEDDVFGDSFLFNQFQ